jgi:hypothetical protein
VPQCRAKWLDRKLELTVSIPPATGIRPWIQICQVGGGQREGPRRLRSPGGYDRVDDSPPGGTVKGRRTPRLGSTTRRLETDPWAWTQATHLLWRICRAAQDVARSGDPRTD